MICSRLRGIATVTVILLAAACGSGGSKGSSSTPDNPDDPGGGGGGGDSTAEAAPDAGPPPVASCEECLGEAGRWWHTDSSTCTAEQGECVDGGNCVDGDPYACPGGTGMCEGEVIGSCVKTTACVDYFGVEGKPLAKLEKACKKGGGTWASVGCDRATAIGGCSQPNKPGCLIAWYGETFQETSPKLREQCATPKKQWLLP
jgi:hypothetical protein